MISRYEIKDFPKVKQIIKIEEIERLIPRDGFLVIQVDAENDDELYDYVEQFGVFAKKYGIDIIVNNKNITVTEIVEKVEKLKQEAIEGELEND